MGVVSITLRLPIADLIVLVSLFLRIRYSAVARARTQCFHVIRLIGSPECIYVLFKMGQFNRPALLLSLQRLNVIENGWRSLINLR